MSNIKVLKDKIHTLPDLLDTVERWKQSGYRTVFTNGCFDLIHRGHIEYLANARSIGDRLIIGVNSDASVSRLKGDHRPIKDQMTRMLVLASFSFVDAVILFNEDTPENLVKAITPDHLVKGGDYTIKQIAGGAHVMRNGGSVVILPFLRGHSTSILESRIRTAD